MWYIQSAFNPYYDKCSLSDTCYSLMDYCGICIKEAQYTSNRTITAANDASTVSKLQLGR
jgi:hypothetical protein